MKKIFLITLLALFLIGIGSAAECDSYLGTFRQGDNISLYQSCANCTWVNLTAIKTPSALIPLGVSMIQNGTDYNYTYAVSELGEYFYTTIGDKDGEIQDETTCFDVTPSGFTGTLGFYFIMLCIILGIFILGFKLQNNYIMMLGSIAILFFGFFIIKFGIDVIKDTQTTWAIGLITWAIGIICIYTCLEEQLKAWG